MEAALVATYLVGLAGLLRGLPEYPSTLVGRGCGPVRAQGFAQVRLGVACVVTAVAPRLGGSGAAGGADGRELRGAGRDVWVGGRPSIAGDRGVGGRGGGCGRAYESGSGSTG